MKALENKASTKKSMLPFRLLIKKKNRIHSKPTSFWSSYDSWRKEIFHMHCKEYTENFETNISRNETAKPQSSYLHLCFCERSTYIFPRSVFLFCCRKTGGPIVEIYYSLTDTWMWKLGLRLRSFFLGVHKSDFLCSVQAAFCTKKSTVNSLNSAFLLKVFCFIKSCKLQCLLLNRG